MIGDQHHPAGRHLFDSVRLHPEVALVQPERRRDGCLGELQLHAERIDAVFVLRRDQPRQPCLQLGPALRERPLLHRAAQPAEKAARPVALVVDQRLRFHREGCSAINCLRQEIAGGLFERAGLARQRRKRRS